MQISGDAQCECSKIVFYLFDASMVAVSRQHTSIARYNSLKHTFLRIALYSKTFNQSDTSQSK